MKKKVQGIVQSLKNNCNHPLFKEQLNMLTRDEYKYRTSLIRNDFNKLKKLVNDQTVRCVGSILSFLFGMFWFLVILPYKIFELIFKLCKIPFQCKRHNKLLDELSKDPEFQKLNKK